MDDDTVRDGFYPFYGVALPMSAFSYVASLVNKAFSDPNPNTLRELGSFFVNSGFQTRAEYLLSVASGKDTGNIYEYLYQEKEKAAIDPSLLANVPFQEEQNYLDRTLAGIDEQIRDDERRIAEVPTAVFSGDEDETNEIRAIAERNGRQKKDIQECQRIRKRPYFARVDVSDDHSGVEKHYIGDTLFLCDADRGIVIESPWSDYRDLFFQNTVSKATIRGNSYVVTLKRRIDIHESVLIKAVTLFDKQTMANSPEEKESQPLVTDPFLLHVMEERRGENEVCNIIRSIQGEQNEIIEAPLHPNLLVQGCAGSGKTMILLHRLSYLCYRNKELDPHRICVVGPNDNYSTFFTNLAEELHLSDIRRTTINGLLFAFLQNYHDQFAPEGAMTSYDTWSKNTIRNSGDPGLASVLYSPAFRVALRERCDAIREKIKASEIRWADELKQADEETEEHQSSGLFNKLKDAFRKDRVSRLFDGNETGLETIRKAVGERVLSHGGSYISAVRYAQILYLYFLFGPLRIVPYDIFCFDEAQDYAYWYWLMIHGICGTKPIFNFYGDLNQAVDPQSSETWKGISSLFKCREYTLPNNYRNSDEIVQYYNDRLDMRDRAMGLKVQPVFHVEKKDLLLYLKLALLFKNRTAFVANDTTIFDLLPLELTCRGHIEEGKVALLSVPEAKGLEFDAVFVYANRMTDNAKYVSLTRALSELYIVTAG